MEKKIAQEDIPFELQLMFAAKSVSEDNPLKYIDLMYKTVNPEALKLAVKDVRSIMNKENKRAGKCFDVFMTLGGDGMHRAMYEGAIGSLLWLNDYVDRAKVVKKLDEKDVETFKKVLRAIDLPSVSDCTTDAATGELKANSSCRHYAYFLADYVRWLTTGVTAFKVKNKMRSNMELCRYLTATGMDSFPSIPFTTYYVGQVKHTDHMLLTEKISKSFDFTKYMSKVSRELNDPKFVIVPENVPLVGIPGHPLANLILGELKNDTVEWLGGFVSSSEFSRICMEWGLTTKEVLNYIYSVSPEAHKQKYSKGDPIAKFIENQHLGKQVFELRHKVYSVENIDEEEIDKLLESDD